jgi:hypothetical protein
VDLDLALHLDLDLDLNLGQSVSGCPDLFGANFNVERTIFWQ